MNRRRLGIIGALARGLVAAILITLAGMLLMAAAVIFLGMSDGLIRALNQALKIVAVALGTFLSVRPGGQRGLVTGAGVGAAYSVIGYCLYVLLGGYSFGIVPLMGEMMICMASGSVTGAVCANLRPATRSAKAAKTA